MQLEVWLVLGPDPKRPLVAHFGTPQGLGMETSRVTWPSDSLFSALVTQWAQLLNPGQLEQRLQPFAQGHPPFLVTSLFPVVVHPCKGVLPFFPAPLKARRSRHPAEQEGDSPKTKELKRVTFVSLGLYRRLLRGETLGEVLQREPRLVKLHKGRVWLLPEEQALLPRAERLWVVEKRPRVTVGRVAAQSTLFHVAAVHFHPRAGLWFGVQWLVDDSQAQAQWKALLEQGLQELAHAGLGGDRNAGYGHARIKPAEPLDLPDPATGRWVTTLSRYWPREEEVPLLQARGSAYTMEVVGGWIHGTSVRRKPVHMLAEAAVLPKAERLPLGRMEDVRPQLGDRTPPHPVYRYGYALAVGMAG